MSADPSSSTAEKIPSFGKLMESIATCAPVVADDDLGSGSGTPQDQVLGGCVPIVVQIGIPLPLPVAPKRPLQSGYLIYAQEQRALIGKEQPRPTPQAVMTRIGAQWKALGLENQKVYLDQAKANLQKYAKDDAVFKRVNPQQTGSKKRKRIENAASNMPAKLPKKPRSAYALYSNAVRPQWKADYPEDSASELKKKIMGAWAELQESARLPYETQAASMAAEYAQSLAAISLAKSNSAAIQSGGENSMQVLKSIASASSSTEISRQVLETDDSPKNADKGHASSGQSPRVQTNGPHAIINQQDSVSLPALAPPSRPPTARKIHAAHVTPDIQQKNPLFKAAKLRRHVADMWEALPETEKAIYQNEHKALLKQWKAKMATFKIQNADTTPKASQHSDSVPRALQVPTAGSSSSRSAQEYEITAKTLSRSVSLAEDVCFIAPEEDQVVSGH
ncbi:MAG: hypothetical protein SGCHY_002064 [Lobulomycetales sp.]